MQDLHESSFPYRIMDRGKGLHKDVVEAVSVHKIKENWKNIDWGTELTDLGVRPLMIK